MTAPPPIWDIHAAGYPYTRAAVSGEEVYRLVPYGFWHTEASLVWWVQDGPIHGGVPVIESMVIA